MARITDEYVKMQKRCRPNIDASHRCIFRCPQCIRQKTSSQEQIRRSFDLEKDDPGLRFISSKFLKIVESKSSRPYAVILPN